MGLLGSTGVYLSQLGSTWVSLGRLGSTWVYLGVLESTRVYLGLLGSAWVYFGLLGFTWVYLVCFRSPKNGLEHSELYVYRMGWVGRLSPAASLLRAPYGANNFEEYPDQVLALVR